MTPNDLEKAPLVTPKTKKADKTKADKTVDRRVVIGLVLGAVALCGVVGGGGLVRTTVHSAQLNSGTVGKQHDAEGLGGCHVDGWYLDKSGTIGGFDDYAKCVKTCPEGYTKKDAKKDAHGGEGPYPNQGNTCEADAFPWKCCGGREGVYDDWVCPYADNNIYEPWHKCPTYANKAFNECLVGQNSWYKDKDGKRIVNTFRVCRDFQFDVCVSYPAGWDCPPVRPRRKASLPRRRRDPPPRNTSTE